MPLLNIAATDHRTNMTFKPANDDNQIQLLATGSGLNVTGPPGCNIPMDKDNATRETMVCEVH